MVHGPENLLPSVVADENKQSEALPEKGFI